ncbi:MAG: hypothetical protein P8125_01460 [Gemmatimonadota bacterium]|jgi:hypothetical protein
MTRATISLILAAASLAAACGPTAKHDWLQGDWVRTGHPEAWFVTFEPDGSARFRNETTDRVIAGRVLAADSTRVEIQFDIPGRWLPDRLELNVSERSEARLDLQDEDGVPWTLVRYGPLPTELLGRWHTLPRNDPRYFIDFERPQQVLWRRKFGMKRSEDRAGAGWTRGDSLFLHIWGAPPMHYNYAIVGDTLSFERPGIGPFGRYHRAE